MEIRRLKRNSRIFFFFSDLNDFDGFIRILAIVEKKINDFEERLTEI